MSRHADGKTHLRTECLGVVPYSEAVVEGIYGMEGPIPKHSIDKLCLSHERLRAELDGILEQARRGIRHEPPLLEMMSRQSSSRRSEKQPA